MSTASSSMQNQLVHSGMVGAIFVGGDKLILGGEVKPSKFIVSAGSELIGQQVASKLGTMLGQTDYASWIRRYVLPGVSSGALYVVGSKMTGVDNRNWLKVGMLQAGASMSHEAIMGSSYYQQLGSWGAAAPSTSGMP